jgi:hypothetical protein
LEDVYLTETISTFVEAVREGIVTVIHERLLTGGVPVFSEFGGDCKRGSLNRSKAAEEFREALLADAIGRSCVEVTNAQGECGFKKLPDGGFVGD